ncbi:MAG: flagellar basal body P-ring formation chaperone FlgA [Noviherbaspirillum sp.]
MKRSTLFILLLCALVPVARAQQHPGLAPAVERFLLTQAQGLPGKVSVSVGAIDARRDHSCAAPEVFLPRGSRAWGRTTVGVRCTAPSAWTVYVSATVKVEGDYLAAAVPLAQGQVLEAGDLATVRGDLASLPPGIITESAQAVGHTMALSVRAGAPLRRELLRAPQAVQNGQVVRLVSSGAGFSVSGEGRALGSASEGQVVQARAANGQVVSGVARMGGVVEINF